MLVLHEDNKQTAHCVVKAENNPISTEDEREKESTSCAEFSNSQGGRKQSLKIKQTLQYWCEEEGVLRCKKKSEF